MSSSMETAIAELTESYGRAVSDHQWRERVWREKQREADTAREEMEAAAERCAALNESIKTLRELP